MLRSLLITSLYLTHVFAQGTAVPKVSDDWVRPQYPDGTTVLTAGQEFELRWTRNLTRWFPGYAPSANVTNVTLWVTGVYQPQYQHVVSAYIDLTNQLGTKWTVNLPDSELEATQDWSFRFLPANETRFTNGQQVSSPQVKIRANSTAPTQPARTGPPNPVSSTAVPTLTPSAIPESSSGGLSPGATAGIAIGTALAALLLAALAWFLLRRRRRARKAALNAPPFTQPEMSAYHDNATAYAGAGPGHHHTASQSSGDYFSAYGQNSHTMRSGTFSTSTFSSGGGSPPSLPAYHMTPGRDSERGVMTPGSDGVATFYAPTPTEKALEAQGQAQVRGGEVEMDVPPGTTLDPSEMTGSAVERSELEAPHGGLRRDEGAGARRD
ncbi:hypothetical protein B9Z65_4059 [Elsinoe australis]|uniref:Uncharacterized protein n=1 Tax=Elsinoe australis TaxID=40998 RepID=A0A2P7Z1Q4_9PEZI|nr:hypothetical protein B9Z65_4059 [Elsinoe australis]